MATISLYGDGRAIKHPSWRCAHYAGNGIRYQKTIDSLIQKELHQDWDLWDLRKATINKSAWFIADTPTLDKIANFLRGKRVLEIAAGTGYFALQMRHRGVSDYRAIDSRESYYNADDINYGVEVVSFYALSLKELARYDVIVITWPPYDSKLAYDIAKAMRKGQTLIYQGELWGCTGSDEYHRYLDKYFLRTDAIFNEEHETPSWRIVKDRWHTYVKESSHRHWSKRND